MAKKSKRKAKPSSAPSTPSSSSAADDHQHVANIMADIMDVPNMHSSGKGSRQGSGRALSSSTGSNNNDGDNANDNQSVDSLDMVSRMIKSNLNSSLRDIREGDERGSSGGGKASSSATHEFDASFNSSRSSGSNRSSRSGRGGNGGQMQKRDSASRLLRRSIEEHHVDMPHLDDILHAASSAHDDDEEEGEDGGEDDRGRRGGGGGVGGGCDTSTRTGGSAIDWATVASSSVDTSPGRKKKGMKGAIVIEDDEAGSTSSRGSKEELLRDHDAVSRMKWPRKGRSRPGPDDDVESSRSLNLDMPTLSESNKNKKSSWIFESLWGGTGSTLSSAAGAATTTVTRNDRGEVDGYIYGNDGSDFSGYDTSTDGGGGRDDDPASSERRPMRIMKTVSGRVGYMRNSDPSMDYRDDYGRRGWGRLGGLGRLGGGGRRDRSTLRYAAVCIVVSVIAAVSIGALVVMVPLWMSSEERSESAELGGLAYDGKDGEVMGIGGAGGGGGDDDGGVGTKPTTAAPGVAGGGSGGLSAQGPGGGGSSSSSSGTVASAGTPSSTSSKFKPPPYNLQLTCGRDLNTPGGYDKCVSACLPSRCCLVKEGETYEVWKRHNFMSPPQQQQEQGHSLMKNNAQGVDVDLPIGTVIQSCFKDNADACVRYSIQCSVLGASTLLPRKSPSKEEVAKMSEGEKLELAERVNHACSKVRKEARDALGGGAGVSRETESECEMLCREKECCFASGGGGSSGGGGGGGSQNIDWVTGSIGTSGSGGGSSSSGTQQDPHVQSYEHDPFAESGFDPTESLMANGFVEVLDYNDEYDASFGDYGTQLNLKGRPSPGPTTWMITDMPTYGASSYKPTPPETEFDFEGWGNRNRGLRGSGTGRELDHGDPSVVHMDIPGEEDFVFVVEDPGAEAGGTSPQMTDPSAVQTSPPPADEGEGSDSAATAGPQGEETDPSSAAPYEPDRGESNKVPSYEEVMAMQKEEEKGAPAVENCVSDPSEFCMTYVGCAPLFGG